MDHRGLLLATAFISLLSGCATMVLTRGGASPSSSEQSAYDPPPGQCRIWYPDRPPEQQPPPGDCQQLAQHVPAGARLLYGPGTKP
jgi:hypothetical protein